MKNKKVVIIGGGASGMMAAISCKKHNPNYEVIILEKNFKLGRKVLATGNGRCNILNNNLDPKRFHTNSKINSDYFIESIFNQFGEDDINNFFQEQNLGLRTENDGRIFPRVNQSLAVVKSLEYELEKLGVNIEYNFNVREIKKETDNFIVTNSIDNSEIISDFLIIATGGLSYKDLGSSGDGYVFAKNFGHKITEFFPSITTLKINNKIIKKISGVRQEAIVRVIVDYKNIKEYFEELLFTDYGVSGSVILQISRFAIEGLLQNKKVEISIQFTNEEITKEQVEKVIRRQILISKGKKIKSVLLWFLNTVLIDSLFMGLENKLCENITEKDIKEIVEILTNTRFTISGYKEWEQAQITSGGINLEDINEKTLESKLVNNLYFCGEVIDIDGDCGGFNLSWAWSSGFVAGQLKKA